jgi:VIT1/CCC1 family predicted Fe2+/Mn2+ transporter
MIGFERASRIRAGVLGASDGIVSVSAILFGMAAAHTGWYELLTVALAGTISGALSMAVGEYVSVSAQDNSVGSATKVSPFGAALASAGSFVAGAALPAVAILVSPNQIRLPITAAAVLLALTLCGYISGHLTNTTQTSRNILRVVVGGALALAITYCAGLIAG